MPEFSMDKFWEHKTLAEMTPHEWESLCDHCGRCCLIKLEDEDNGELFYTNVVCEHHDDNTCQCTHYDDRNLLVPDCIKVTPEVAVSEKWLPNTCAYRLLAEGQPLFDWHPLISGRQNSVREAQITIQGKVISEQYVHLDELAEHLVNWFDKQ